MGNPNCKRENTHTHTWVHRIESVEIIGGAKLSGRKLENGLALIVFFVLVNILLRQQWYVRPDCRRHRVSPSTWTRCKAIQAGKRVSSRRMHTNDWKCTRKWHRWRHFAHFIVELRIKNAETRCRSAQHKYAQHTSTMTNNRNGNWRQLCV